jgi:hypothetical protein
MGGRFNKHVPHLCCECGRPLCVRDKRSCFIGGVDFPYCSTCAWNAYEKYREEFETSNAGFWQEAELVEPVGEAETFWISEGDLFG